MCEKVCLKVFRLALIFVLFLSGFLIFQGYAQGGFGVSPSTLKIVNAYKGEEYLRAFTISSNFSAALNFSLVVEEGFEDWVRFYTDYDRTIEVSSVIIQACGSQRVYAVFMVPEDAPICNYSFNIYVKTGGGRVENGLGVVLSVPIRVEIFPTGTQILDARVEGVKVSSVEEGDAMPILVYVTNTGNVKVKPKVEASIYRDEQFVDRIECEGEWIKPNLQSTVKLEWETLNRPVGNYTANVTTSINGKVIDTRKVGFEILPYGSLKSQGAMLNFKYEGQPSVGSLIKLIATFKNTGEIPTKAQLNIEIYKDGQLIDVVKSEQLLIQTLTAENLTAYYKLPSPGNYKMIGYIIYGIKKTQTMELDINVGSPWQLTSYLTILGLVGAATITFITLKNKKKRLRKNPNLS
jgi:hypothetical protein